DCLRTKFFEGSAELIGSKRNRGKQRGGWFASRRSKDSFQPTAASEYRPDHPDSQSLVPPPASYRLALRTGRYFRYLYRYLCEECLRRHLCVEQQTLC